MSDPTPSITSIEQILTKVTPDAWGDQEISKKQAAQALEALITEEVTKARIDEVEQMLSKFDLEGSRITEILIHDHLATLQAQLTNKESQ